MDLVSEAFLALHFRTAFLEKKGTEFQDWFAKLASDAHGVDFEIVGPYGNQGDWKCDGRMVSTGFVAQILGWDSLYESGVITGRHEQLGPYQI